ncbi:hypothetical protein AFSV47Ss_0226 [African swine fever virus]|uniref:Uncharacterized protein n=1 Tax=African swine fever virus TaxID=10497 RepID=A0A6G6AHX9_ASF|nr:hypothetical protein AFSV47Ss_0226 [African swine fever virus]
MTRSTSALLQPSRCGKPTTSSARVPGSRWRSIGSASSAGSRAWRSSYLRCSCGKKSYWSSSKKSWGERTSFFLRCERSLARRRLRSGAETSPLRLPPIK